MRKKPEADLPVYSIETFDQKKPDAIRLAGSPMRFSMGLLHENVKDYQFACTPHRHDCYFIMFVTKGTGQHTIDRTTYEVKPYSAFIMVPGQVHSWAFSDDITGFSIYFRLDFYNEYVRDRHLERFPFFRDRNVQNHFLLDKDAEQLLPGMLLDMHAEFVRKSQGWQDVVRNCLDSLLIRLARYSRKEEMINGSLTTTLQIRALQNLIEENYTTMKLPSQYAKKMNVSPNHLNAICKRTVNQTVTSLITERIILEAQRKLRYTDKAIKQISVELGYRDVFYFMRFFKKQTGQTPDQFRKAEAQTPRADCA